MGVSFFVSERTVTHLSRGFGGSLTASAGGVIKDATWGIAPGRGGDTE